MRRLGGKLLGRRWGNLMWGVEEWQRKWALPVDYCYTTRSVVKFASYSTIKYIFSTDLLQLQLHILWYSIEIIWSRNIAPAAKEVTQDTYNHFGPPLVSNSESVTPTWPLERRVYPVAVPDGRTKLHPPRMTKKALLKRVSAATWVQLTL